MEILKTIYTCKLCILGKYLNNFKYQTFQNDVFICVYKCVYIFYILFSRVYEATCVFFTHTHKSKSKSKSKKNNAIEFIFLVV